MYDYEACEKYPLDLHLTTDTAAHSSQSKFILFYEQNCM